MTDYKDTEFIDITDSQLMDSLVKEAEEATQGELPEETVPEQTPAAEPEMPPQEPETGDGEVTPAEEEVPVVPAEAESPEAETPEAEIPEEEAAEVQPAEEDAPEEETPEEEAAEAEPTEENEPETGEAQAESAEEAAPEAESSEEYPAEVYPEAESSEEAEPSEAPVEEIYDGEYPAEVYPEDYPAEAEPSETPVEEIYDEEYPEEEYPDEEYPDEEYPEEYRGEDLGNISGRDLARYLNDIDQAYEERKARRQKRLRSKKRRRFLRRFLLTLIFLALLITAAGCFYIKKADDLPFVLPEPLETYVYKLTPVEQKAEELLYRLGLGSAPVRETEPETAAETETPSQPESAAESEGAETPDETETPAETETQPSGMPEMPSVTIPIITEGTLKQGSTLDPEVAGFFKGYAIDASDAPELSDPGEDIISSGAVLIDLDEGKVIAQRGGEKVISPASMTKILTILVAAEHLKESQLDDTAALDVATADYVFEKNCSVADLNVGEAVPVRDLFYGTILPSGGDAAITLAKYVAGSHEAFVELMNQKAAELGLSDTAHFTNCVGIYNEDLHCTLTDMAMILKAAVENDWCRQVLSTHTYETKPTPTTPDGILHSNWFLRRIEDYDTNGEVRCAKTGFVDEAGCCAASYMIGENGKHYICVTCNSSSSWQCIYDQIKIYSDYVK